MLLAQFADLAFGRFECPLLRSPPQLVEGLRRDIESSRTHGTMLREVRRLWSRASNL